MKIQDGLKISEALKVFHGQERLGDEAYKQPVNYANFVVVKVPYPNLKQRRELVHLHDINHILTGYDTSWVGEGEVAAWELASGFPGRAWVGYLYAPFSLVIGFFFGPSRIVRAFRRGLREKNSCHAPLSKEELFNSTVGELKKVLGIG